MEKLFENEFQDLYYKGLKAAGLSKTYYVIYVGSEIGIFDNWDDVKARTNGYSGAIQKSFKSYREAELSLKNYINNQLIQ